MTLTVSDDDFSSSDTAQVEIGNVAPAVGPVTAATEPVAVGTSVSAQAAFTDPGILDTHLVSWEWGDGTISRWDRSRSGGSGSVYGSHVYTAPGVYPVTARVTDKDGGTSSNTFEYVVVYDPIRRVCRRRWLDSASPAGAYVVDPALTGRASFGFVSKYKGAAAPTARPSSS